MKIHIMILYKKNKILYNATTDEIYFYDDLLDDSYINLMEVIKRGTTKQTKIVGEWYELIIDRKNFINFIMKYKSNKVFKVNNFNIFKSFFIEKLNYINNVIYENPLKENYVFLYSSYDVIMRD